MANEEVALSGLVLQAADKIQPEVIIEKGTAFSGPPLLCID
jgi:hypothetical protein